MLTTFKLKNGIKVACFNIDSLKSVHLEAIVKAGGIFETKNNNGVAHFMEHMLVQGTPSLPNAEIFSSHIESLAGTYGAHTDLLTVNFEITLPKTELESATRITSEVMFEPIFAEEAIEKERIAVINEINQRVDSHWYKLNEYYRQVRFKKNHPLSIDVGGDLKVINKLRREDLVEFWKKYFVPENLHLLIVGNFNLKTLKKLLNNYFGKNNSKSKFPGFPKLSNSDFSASNVFIRNDNTLSSCYIDLNFPSIDLDAKKETSLKQSMLLVILGRLRNSRLFKLLRYQKGLVYGVSSSSMAIPGMGAVYINSETTPEKLEEVITLITKEIENFIKFGITEDELKFAKHFLENQWLMSFDHPSSIAGWIESDFLWKDKIGLPEDYAKDIAKLDTNDLLNMMQKNWDFSKLNLILQGPIEDTKENKEKFERIIGGLSNP